MICVRPKCFRPSRRVRFAPKADKYVDISRVLLLLTALGLAGCADTFARRDDAKCRAMGAQRGTDRYDNCRMTLKENRNGVVTVRVR